MQILPVIHYLAPAIAIDQANLAFEAGADGVFLISHEGRDAELPAVGRAIKSDYPGKLIGLNFLAAGAESACRSVVEFGLDMVWGDVCGVSSTGLTDMGTRLQEFVRTQPQIKLFASVAFKYQPLEDNPALAAKHTLDAGFLPTTSGPATGHPPTVEKIAAMSAETGGQLAVASGMSVDNVSRYVDYLSHILVATAVSRDEHHFDFELLSRFIGMARK